jgi:hypothetical protein
MFSFSRSLALLACIVLLPQIAVAEPLHGAGVLGQFQGTMTYSAANANQATLVIELTNTTPVHLGGYITAFVFNNPNDWITSVTSFSSTDPDFKLIVGSPALNNGINGAPFGKFDVGTSLGNDFQGSGGAPQPGIGVGQSASFTFAFAGNYLDQLTAASFLETLSEGTGAGQGYEAFVVRFKGFANGGSDKVPHHHQPEPSSLALAGVGIAALLRARFARRNV